MFVEFNERGRGEEESPRKENRHSKGYPEKTDPCDRGVLSGTGEAFARRMRQKTDPRPLA